jgi:hypothetical protein
MFLSKAQRRVYTRLLLLISVIANISSCTYGQFEKSYEHWGISEKRIANKRLLASHSKLNGPINSLESDYVEIIRNKNYSFFAHKNFKAQTKSMLSSCCFIDNKLVESFIKKNINSTIMDVVGFINLRVEIVLVPNNYSYESVFWSEVENGSATLRFAFNLNNSELEYSVRNIINTVTHEIIHAKFRLLNRQPANSLSNEVIASLVGLCAESKAFNQIPYPSFPVLPNEEIMNKVYEANLVKILEVFEHHDEIYLAYTLAQKIIKQIIDDESYTESQKLIRLLEICKSSWQKNYNFRETINI